MKKTAAKAASIILTFALMFSASGHFTKASAETARRFVPQSTYLSPVMDAPMVYTGLGIEWHQLTPEGTSAELSLRFKDINGKWSDWNDVAGDTEGPDDSAPEYLSSFLAAPASESLQYRVYLHTEDTSKTPVLENIRFTYINSKRKVAVKAEKVTASLGGVARVASSAEVPATVGTATTLIAAADTTATVGTTVGTAETAKANDLSTSVKIISRSDWGADESLRVYAEDRPTAQLVKTEDDFYTKYASEMKITKEVKQNSAGQDLTWPLDYPEKVSKIVIHHTATTKNLDDPEKAIRDIYYWHTISKGWGDIGYNYIIDQQGNIYEGRAGGDGVVGAHAGRGNIGSIGIAILGNYQEKDVPDAVVNSLTALIKLKTAKYGIDPTGSSSFRGEYLPNIMGHRDIMSTTCPGDKLYNLLPAIRLAAKGDFKPKIIDRRRLTAGKESDYDYSLQKNPNLLTLQPGGKQTLQLTVKNTGKKSWGPATSLLVSNTESAQTFLAASSMVGSKAYGKTIAPGSSATFNIDLQSGYTGGIATLEVFPFVDGKTRVEKYISIPVQIEQPSYDYEFVKLDLNKTYLKKGETVDAVLTLKNTGNTTWKRDGANKFLIGTDKPRDRVSKITPVPGARLGKLTEKEVKPGGTAHFNITIKAPQTEGAYKEYYAPVMEGVTWLASKDKSIDLYVYETQFLAKSAGASGSLTLQPGAKGTVTMEYLNAGGNLWKLAGEKGFRLEVADQKNLKIGEIKVEQDQILPGQKAKINIAVTAPATEGTYQLSLMPKVGARNLMARPEAVYIKVGKGKAGTQTAGSSGQTGTTSSSATTASAGNIRVDISFHSNPVISATGAFSLYEGSKKQGAFIKDEKVSVTYDGGKYAVKGDKQAYSTTTPPRFKPDTGSILRIDNYENRPAWDTSYNDNEFRGVLEVVKYDDEMHTVNELPVEDYLKGLAEISATDPYEKIKAVIVLARSYAYYYTKVGEKFPGAPYNLSDDPQRSQKYLGYAFEKRNPTGVKAVNDTAGIVVKYDGKLIKTPYFSSDDGRTRSAEEVWGWKDTPWLVSVDDPGCDGMTMNGHGVGLSGCGSLYLGNQGKTFKEIISYYFKGVTVEKL
jgi:hypothetical protein